MCNEDAVRTVHICAYISQNDVTFKSTLVCYSNFPPSATGLGYLQNESKFTTTITNSGMDFYPL